MTTTKPGALAALLTDIHTAVRNIHGAQQFPPDPLRNVQDAFERHIGADWRRLPLQDVLPEVEHTPKCIEMGWWLLHNVAADGPCEPGVAAPDAGNPELPVPDTTTS